MKRSKNSILALIALLALHFGFGQTLVWDGAADNDFYNEANWVVEGTENRPEAGTLDAGAPIAFNLLLKNAAIDLSEGAPLSFASDEIGLTLRAGLFQLSSLSAGFIAITDTSTLILHASEPLGAEASLKLEDAHSWIKLLYVNPVEAAVGFISKITSEGLALTIGTDVLVNQYYYDGSLIRLKDANFKPLTLFDNAGQDGQAFYVPTDQVYGRTQFGSFENKATSFRLERGYMATMAIFQNGTGKSEVFIASEEPLEIDLPMALNNTVSFVRVMPWNWVTKKGASKFKEVGNTWTYNWNRTGESLPNMEYAPMAWGGDGATDAAVAQYIAKDNVTHVLGFNESDNCNGQSGQYGNLCQISVAVPTFKNLMRTGLRLASPSPREDGPLNNNWLVQFRDAAIEQDVRYDVLGVHWYDWGGNPVNTPFADAQQVFNRFKTYLTNVYNTHGLPIWITEFNANPNRDVSVHQAFLELALPYLESLDYIERYDYFEPMPDVAGNRDDITYARLFDDQGNITPLGEFYRDFQSTPSIPEATYAGSEFLSGLETKIPIRMTLSTNEIAEGQLITLTFTADRNVGAAETFSVSVSLGAEQYTLSAGSVTITEGTKTASITLRGVDDTLVEDLMTGTISLTNLSSGVEWTESPASFTLSSDDVEIPLSVDGKKKLGMYPNPTERFVTVAAETPIEQVGVFSLEGRELPNVSLTNNTLDLVYAEQGMYVIRVQLSGGDTINQLVYKK